MQIPFLNLKAHHQPLKADFMAAIEEVVDSNAFAGGPYVEKFEQDFAAFCGAKFSLGVGNGTDAIWMALLALGIGPGDEVITAPNSFIATAEAISFCGAKPVFVDIDEATYTINPALIEAAITPRTKAIVPVHLYGQMADMDPIMEIARKHGLHVVEDACQAHGAEYKGRKAGTIGAAGAFSFYPGKNIGAFGEGGGITTNSPELNQKIRMFRDHGQSKKYHHAIVGWNGRMDGIQGAVLRIKLRHLAKNNAARRAHAAIYDQAFKGLPGIVAPKTAGERVHVFHLYVVRVQNRDAFMATLSAKGIGTAIHYPVPLHLTEAYQSLGYKKGAFPVAERCAAEIVSLPMFPELTPDQVQIVTQEVKACLAA